MPEIYIMLLTNITTINLIKNVFLRGKKETKILLDKVLYRLQIICKTNAPIKIWSLILYLLSKKKSSKMLLVKEFNFSKRRVISLDAGKLLTTWKQSPMSYTYATYKTLSKTFLHHPYIPGIWVMKWIAFPSSLILEVLY